MNNVTTFIFNALIILVDAQYYKHITHTVHTHYTHITK